MQPTLGGGAACVPRSQLHHAGGTPVQLVSTDPQESPVTKQPVPIRTDPQGSPVQSDGSDPQGAPVQSDGSDPQGAPVQSDGSDPQGVPVQSDGSDPQGTPVQSNGSDPQGAPVQLDGSDPQRAPIQIARTNHTSTGGMVCKSPVPPTHSQDVLGKLQMFEITRGSTPFRLSHLEISVSTAPVSD